MNSGLQSTFPFDKIEVKRKNISTAMKEFLSSLSKQSPAAGSQEGLPFGIFWFLVSVIILLIFFIFLRDKDLRRRINLFFFGTKQKLIKIRLQGRLKRERKKKDALLQNMGKTVWEQKINLAGITPYFEALNSLEAERSLKEEKIIDIEAQIFRLKDDLEKNLQDVGKRRSERMESRKRIEAQSQAIEDAKNKILDDSQKEKKYIRSIEKDMKINEKDIHELEKANPPGENGIAENTSGLKSTLAELTQKKSDAEKRLEELSLKKNESLKDLKHINKDLAEHDKVIEALQREEKEKKRLSALKIKSLDREKERIQKKIQDIRNQTPPIFQNLGIMAESQRPKQLDLAVFYNQFDRAQSRIDDLKEQIKNLE